jgi:hypothetical protein
MMCWGAVMVVGLIVILGLWGLCKIASQAGAEIDGIMGTDDPYQTGL